MHPTTRPTPSALKSFSLWQLPAKENGLRAEEQTESTTLLHVPRIGTKAYSCPGIGANTAVFRAVFNVVETQPIRPRDAEA